MAQKCAGTNRDGTPCSIEFGICEECGLCFQHCEHRADERRAAKRAGGKATGRKLHAPGLDPDELPPLETHAEAKEWLEIVGRAVATGRLSDRSGQAVIRAVSEWVKAHGEELTAEVVDDLRGEVDRLKSELSGKPNLRPVS